jgi:predicted PP-loop superfamily ATPase
MFWATMLKEFWVCEMSIGVKTYLEKKVYPFVDSDVKKVLMSNIEPFLTNYLKPTGKINTTSAAAIVGLSGGADSIATLFLAKRFGFEPIAVNLDYGTTLFNYDYKKGIKRIAKKLGVKSVSIPIGRRYLSLIARDLKKGNKPCKMCVEMKINQLKDICKKRNISFLIVGDMASTDKPIEIIDKKLVRINMPSIFSMNEKTMIDLSKKVTKDNVVYACPVPLLIKKYNIKLNDELKLFWIKKILNWNDSMGEKETFRLLRNIIDFK